MLSRMKKRWLLLALVLAPPACLALLLGALAVFDLLRPLKTYEAAAQRALAEKQSNIHPASGPQNVTASLSPTAATVSLASGPKAPSPAPQHKTASTTTPAAGRPSAISAADAALRDKLLVFGRESLQLSKRFFTSESLALRRGPLFAHRAAFNQDDLARRRQVNDQYEAIVHKLLEYHQAERWRNFEDGKARLAEIKKDFAKFEHNFGRVQYQTYHLDDLKSIHLTLNEYGKISQSAWDRYYRLRTEILISEQSLCLAHQRWREYAEYTRGIYQPDWSQELLAPPQDHRQNARENWEEELFALRLMGEPGKSLILRRSVERNWTALKRSALSIGYRFDWPHHEEGD